MENEPSQSMAEAFKRRADPYRLGGAPPEEWQRETKTQGREREAWALC